MTNKKTYHNKGEFLKEYYTERLIIEIDGIKNLVFRLKHKANIRQQDDRIKVYIIAD